MLIVFNFKKIIIY